MLTCEEVPFEQPEWKTLTGAALFEDAMHALSQPAVDNVCWCLKQAVLLTLQSLAPDAAVQAVSEQIKAIPDDQEFDPAEEDRDVTHNAAAYIFRAVQVCTDNGNFQVSQAKELAQMILRKQ